MSGRSVATIKSPEFINITSINPLISKCEIKVMYVGQNRNHSYITKEVATQMAQSLPGTPIVGYYSEKAEDFGDHGEQIVIDNDGIKFNCLTKPYGFVSLDTKVWFQEFEDTDEFGNTTIREYLMCNGYLWTQQYEEAQKIINEGRPHSMELDGETLKGHWSTDTQKGIEFFIIDDALFSKLCILGEDVEPCFEGSSITAPEVSSSFSYKVDDFKNSLFTMMKELKELTYSLNNKEGGSSMNENEVMTEVIEQPAAEEFELENSESSAEVETEAEVNDSTEGVEEAEEKNVEFSNENLDNSVEEDTLEKEDNTKGEEISEDEEVAEESTDSTSEEPEAPAQNNEDYSLLQEKFTKLQEDYENLVKENQELVAFKKTIENKEKDELINKFYMLSDEDKKDVIENKEKYSLDDIEAKLSVICVRKKVNFDKEEDNTSNLDEALLYTFNNPSEDFIPAWIKAVEEHKNSVK